MMRVAQALEVQLVKKQVDITTVGDYVVNLCRLCKGALCFAHTAPRVDC